MKLNMFKIRRFNGADSHLSEVANTPDTKQDALHRSVEVCQENMNHLMSMFETFMKHTLKGNNPKDSSVYDAETFNKSELQYEIRDRQIILQVPSFNEEELSPSSIEKWTTEICSAAFSSTFNYYLTQQMTFQQAKVFCSETILGNILRFTQKYHLNDKQMEIINKHLSGSALEYLQMKYPLTLANDVNKALDREVQPMDNFDNFTNDFLYFNEIIFKYRESGNYNDMIMKVINKAMQIVDDTSTMTATMTQITTGVSNYQDFEIYVSQLFEKVYDEEWVYGYKIGNKFKGRQDEQREKYAEKVKDYTKYLIGRKISENTPQFTQQEMVGQNLIIKSPAMLRILTKWCEQLWAKFAKESYYAERAEPVILQDPEFINPFFKWMKTSVDKRLSMEKTKIQVFKKQLDSHCNFQEAVVLLKYLQEDQVNFISKYEKAYGKFSTHMVKNLHSYIILYLNRLIHGLLTVSKEFYEKEVDKSWDGWQSPPNLVTFKIGDLIRCKCSSKEKEIMKIFRQIKNISNANPERLKIIRIKNRLREGTNDILVNVRFNDKIVCEIQLQVINKSKTKFIECSNAFSHFIYQLKRSIFGPISQLCNIWNNFDVRSKAFLKLINKEEDVNLSHTLQVPRCSNTQEHDFDKYALPFQCSLCGHSYFHSNYIFSNKKCKTCSFFFCVNCQIKKLSSEELKNDIFKQKKDEELKNSCTKLTDGKVPSYGVCVKIQSKEVKIQLFRYMKVESKFWLFGVNQDKSLYQIQRARTPKEISAFLRSYCIFDLSNSGKFIQITDKEAMFFSVQEYLRECYQQNRESLILTQIRFNDEEMRKLLQNDGGSEKDRKMIKKIEFASNYISDISYFSCFDNLTDINIDFNYFINTTQMKLWKKLQKIEMRDNSKLTEIGEEIGELQKLQEFKCSNSAICKVSENIGKLKNLIVFKADKNKITNFPDSICDLINLKFLICNNNLLEKVPENIGNLVNLKTLKLSSNNLKVLPDSIFNLTNLTILSLFSNKLINCPNTKSLTKLEKLELQNNQISELPPNSFESQSLKYISLSSNKLIKFDVDMSKCRNLEYLSLNKNSLNEISESLVNCTNLTTLDLFDNQLDHVPLFLSKLKKLPAILNFKLNKVKEVPEILKQMTWITQINFQKNEIRQLPPWLSQVSQLKILNFANNSIKVIPDDFRALKDLEKFDFKGNQIEEIPDFIAEFSFVKATGLNIDSAFRDNHISKLSPQIVKAMKGSISLTNNRIENIPIAEVEDKAIVILINFINNKIKEIPLEIKQFKNLKNLLLDKNLIEIVPSGLAQLESLSVNGLALSQNPLKTVECKDFLKAKGTYQTKNLLKRIEQEDKVGQVSNFIKDSSSDDQ